MENKGTPRVSRTRPNTPIIGRIARVRPSAPVARIQRAPRPLRALDSRQLPLFIIDWRRPLSWKFSIYMVTSFLYYMRSKSVITDSDFDRLCVELCENYDNFEHQHKHLVDRGQLQAGTGYDIAYPLMVKNAAEHLLSRHAER